MKKVILSTVLLSGLVLAVAVPTASAAEKETSKVELKLTEDGGHEPGTGPFKDKLSIVYKPTVFKFESEVEPGSLVLDNKHTKIEEQYLAVNDDRKDETTGERKSSPWVVTGKLSTLDDGSDSIAAKLNVSPTTIKKYDIGELKTVDGVEDFELLPINPAATNATGYTTTDFSLIAGGSAVKVISKDDDTTETTDKPDGVFTNLGHSKLAIATGVAKKGDYKGTIEWVLAAQP